MGGVKTIPLEIMATHVAIVGKTGSGKTYTAKGLVERLLEANRRVIVLDELPRNAVGKILKRELRERFFPKNAPVAGATA